MSVGRAASRPAQAIRGFRGEVITPADPEYETARWVHNVAVDRRPAMIARPSDAADVATAITFARQEGLPLVVRAGGHSMAGYGTADGALVIDLSSLRSIEMDAASHSAWAGGGVLAGDYTRAAHALGYATPFGDTGSVGVAGITLGGGVGWLVRKHGMTIDSLLAVEIVTADGQVRIASPDMEPDLFWAVRGAGANFGVVTRLQYRLHPLDQVLAGEILLPATADVLRGLVPVLSAAPDELTAMPFIMLAPEDPDIPAGLHGRYVVYLAVAWSGEAEAGEAALKPLRALGTPVTESIAWQPYPDLFPASSSDGSREGVSSRALFIDSIDDRMVEAIRRLEASGGPRTHLELRVLGGAMGRVPDDATAFGWRGEPALLWIVVPFDDVDRAAEHEAWASAVHADLAGGAAPSYVNFMGIEPAEAVRSAYPPATLARLRDLKRRYDPENVFRSNLNIPPA